MTSKTGLIFLLMLGLIATKTFAQDKNSEEYFVKEIEIVSKEKTRLSTELLREVGMLRASKRANETKSAAELIPQDDQRRVTLKELKDREFELLEKLTTLKPNKPEYQYKLALSCFERREIERGLNIINSISPLNKSGHPLGHLFLANYHLKAKPNSKSEAMANLAKARTHVERCLSQDDSNVDALKIKGSLLMITQEHAGAYEVYERLFALDPKYYEPLRGINIRLGRPEKNESVLNEAIERFNKSLVGSKPPSLSERIGVFQSLTKCYVIKKDFETIESRLLEEIKFQDQMQKGKKVVWPKQLLAKTYGAWAGEFPRTTLESSKARLELFQRSYNLNPSDELVLRELARLGNDNVEEIANEARKIYDAASDNEAPAMVLNELGTGALANGKHDAAIRYFELARQKAPQNAEVLNNLAYAYLGGTHPNPKRALNLVNEALSVLPNVPQNEKYRTHFHDTKGKALLQLNQVAEALASFESALRGRPENEEILESLIKCSQSLGHDSGAYEKQLSKIRALSKKEN